jgi:uncharacterized membrane protein YoaK (UPF0700 family)
VVSVAHVVLHRLSLVVEARDGGVGTGPNRQGRRPKGLDIAARLLLNPCIYWLQPRQTAVDAGAVAVGDAAKIGRPAVTFAENGRATPVPQACILAAIAGYADTIGFLRFDAFAGLMTGNTILLGIGLATAQLLRAAFYAAIIGAFLTGVVLSRALLQSGAARWTALTLTAVLHVVCSFVDKFWAPLLLALAMGMQNAAATRFGSVSLNTVFITGNLQKLGEGLVAWLWTHRAPTTAASDGVAIFALVWLSYAVGAFLGALGNAFLAYPLLAPAAVLPFVYAPLRRLARR